jgi:hypothetical protein
MKTTLKSLGAVILGGGLFISACTNGQLTSFSSLKNPELASRLKSFVAEKEAQAKADEKMPSELGVLRGSQRRLRGHNARNYERTMPDHLARQMSVFVAQRGKVVVDTLALEASARAMKICHGLWNHHRLHPGEASTSAARC